MDQNLTGPWHGTLAGKLRLVVTLAKAEEGGYGGSLESVDQHATLPISNAALAGTKVRFEVKPVGGVFEGALARDGQSMAGSWTQTHVPAQPLSFQRGPLEAGSKAPAPSRRGLEQPALAGLPLKAPLSPPIDIVAPIAPTPFVANGKTHLVYELHVTNLGGAKVALTSLAVQSGDSSRKELAKFQGAELANTFAPFGPRTEAGATTLGPGLSAVLYLWVTLAKGVAAPTSLLHRMALKVGDDPEEMTLEGAPVSVDQRPLVVLSPPLLGGEWRAANGPANQSAHRRAIVPIDGHAAIAQRFAIDWVRQFPGGQTFQGSPDANAHYRAYGEAVYAVADGIAIEVKDQIPENPPGSARAVPITLQTIAGNHIVLDLGASRFALFAHLQPGSLRVKTGDRVRRGQLLGRVGNSGNSSEPHLHFHVCDKGSPLGCEGLPYAFAAYEVEGEKGAQTLQAKPVGHTGELPLENQLIRFPAIAK